MSQKEWGNLFLFYPEIVGFCGNVSKRMRKNFPFYQWLRWCVLSRWDRSPGALWVKNETSPNNRVVAYVLSACFVDLLLSSFRRRIVPRFCHFPPQAQIQGSAKLLLHHSRQYLQNMIVKEEVAFKPNQQPHANHHLLYFPLHVDVLQPPWVIPDSVHVSSIPDCDSDKTDFSLFSNSYLRKRVKLARLILTGKDGPSPPLLLVMITEHKRSQKGQNFHRNMGELVPFSGIW